MFDDLPSLENQTEENQKPSEEEDKPARTLAVWSHMIGFAVFCLLYFPFMDRPWSWPVAVAVSYSVFVFAFALGLSLFNADDFFGDPRVPKYVAELFLPHGPVLALITIAAWLWLRAFPLLPHWMTVESQYKHVSLWNLCLIVLVVFAGRKEGAWLAGKIKRKFAESGD